MDVPAWLASNAAGPTSITPALPARGRVLGLRRRWSDRRGVVADLATAVSRLRARGAPRVMNVLNSALYLLVRFQSSPHSRSPLVWGPVAARGTPPRLRGYRVRVVSVSASWRGRIARVAATRSHRALEPPPPGCGPARTGHLVVPTRPSVAWFPRPGAPNKSRHPRRPRVRRYGAPAARAWAVRARLQGRGGRRPEVFLMTAWGGHDPRLRPCGSFRSPSFGLLRATLLALARGRGPTLALYTCWSPSAIPFVADRAPATARPAVMLAPWVALPRRLSGAPPGCCRARLAPRWVDSGVRRSGTATRTLAWHPRRVALAGARRSRSIPRFRGMRTNRFGHLGEERDGARPRRRPASPHFQRARGLAAPLTQARSAIFAEARRALDGPGVILVSDRSAGGDVPGPSPPFPRAWLRCERVGCVRQLHGAPRKSTLRGTVRRALHGAGRSFIAGRRCLKR
jgi:hypothetical protein